MNAIVKKTGLHKFEPVLQKVLREARTEHRELEEVFDLLGWGALPEEIKIEIKEDVKGFKNELNGSYSTCDPFVIQRRRRVNYWIRSFLSGDCTLQTALQAVRLRVA